MSDDKTLKLLETERRYVAREMHDGVAQTVQQLGLQAAICRRLLERSQTERLAEELAGLEERIQKAAGQIREIINDLRPPQVEPAADLIDYLQQAIDTHHQRGGPPVEYSDELSGPLPELASLELLALARMVQEALLNVRKHAQASQVRLVLGETDESFYMIVADNGPGFDPGGRPGGAGLANLQARAALLGGTAAISRDAAGEWTEIRISQPK